MRINLVAIGNSKGIRIPSSILRHCNVGEQMELEVKKNRLILKPVKSKPRKDWDKAFKKMHEKREDILLLNESIDKEVENSLLLHLSIKNDRIHL